MKVLYVTAECWPFAKTGGLGDVSYALPKEWLKIIGISSCRFNLTCQNVFNFLNPYPEGAWASWAGSYGYYPNLRKFTLGVNVSF